MNRELRFRLAVDGAQQSSAAVDTLSGAFARSEASANRLQARTSGVATALAGLTSGIGITALVNKFSAAAGAYARSADEISRLNTALRLATPTAEAATIAYSRLYAIAQQSRVGFADLGNTYARISRSTADLGISQQRLLTATKAISDAVAISGASAEAANAALVQLGQGLAAGALRGDELNSVMEQLPRLAQAIAAGLGRSLGELRELGRQGQLTAQDIIKALESQSETLAREVAGSLQTVAGAMTQFENARAALVGQLDQSSGASSFMAAQMRILTDAADDMRRSMAGAAREGGGWWAQMLAGGGAVLRFLNPMNALSYTARDLGEQLRAATAALDEMRGILASNPGDILLAGRIADTQRLIDRLKEAKAAQDALELGPRTTARQIDNAIDAAAAADVARRRKLADDTLAKYASPNEKLAAELKRVAAELGDQFTPELARRITEHYVKPTDEAGKAAKDFTTSLDAQAAKLREQVIEMTAGAEAALAFRAAQLGIGSATAAQRAEVAALTAAVKRQSDEQAAAKEAAEARAKADAEALRALVRYSEELDKQSAAEQQTTQALRDELFALTAGTQAMEDLTAARAEEAAVAAERLALARYDLTRDDEELRKLQAIARELRNQAALRRQIGEAAADKEATERATQEWQRASDQIGQSLADALMDGAQSAAEAMKNLFRTIVLRPVIQAVINPVAGALAGALGLGSSPAIAAGSAGSSLGGIGNLLSLAGGAFGAFGGAAGVGLGATLGGAGLGEILAGAGAMIGQGTAAGIAGGIGLGLGAIAPYAAAAAGLYYLGKKAFGRTQTDAGVQGTFSGAGDFTGVNYGFYKGGWFRRDKTETAPLSSGIEAVFDAGAQAVATSARAYAEVLGLPAKAIDRVRQQVQLSFAGLNEKEIQEKIQAAIQEFGEGVARQFAPGLEPFAKAGETLAQTFERLAGIQSFSRTLNELGGVFSRVSWLSIDAREHLFELAGGMQALGQQAAQFVQDYYGRDEIAGIKADEIQARLAAVGITQDIASREQFRALVDSLDVSSAKGREQLATLLAASGSFTGLSDYLAETGLTLQQAAAQAPDAGPLPGLFGPGGQLEQISAINNVALSVDRVYGAVMEVVGAIKAQPAPPPIVFQPWEVGGMAVSGGT